jgi:CelD/BcsL family acetyltransferase involved in cellulose biosynthesis
VEKILEYLVKGKDGWDSIELLNIPEYSKTLNIMSQVCKNMRKKFEISRDMVCPSLRIEGDLEFAKSCLKKKSTARHYNYFKKNGELIYMRLSTDEEIESHLEPFFEQHIKRRDLAEESSLFLIPNRKAFYRYLVRFMPRDWIHFTVLTFNGVPIAYHFGFSYGNKLTWYKPSFDVSYANHSPGETLLFFLIKESIENGARELDFTIGDEAFKRRFSNLIRYNYRVDYVRNKALDFYWKSMSGLKKMRGIIKQVK